LFLSSGCSTLQADTTQRVNLLKAGDLSDTQAYVKHWQTPQTTIAQITSVDAPKDINHYLQVNTGNEVRRHYGYIGQKATVKPNTLYTVKAMLRSESKDNGFVQIKRYKDGKETQRFNIGQSDGPRWKTLTDTFNSGDTQIIEILLRWNARQSYLNQTVDFAKVSLIEVGPAPTESASYEPVAIPTFHSVGLYWKPKEAAADNPCTVAYRKNGEVDWKQAMPLWLDPNDHAFPATRHSGEYRGSIVYLEPATQYEIQLTLTQTNTTQTFTTTTWDENFPIAKRIQIPDGNDTLNIEEGGDSKNGYVLYEPAPGATGIRDAQNKHAVNISVYASYVIIKGFKLKNAGQHGIDLRDVQHVIIDDCDISGWGRVRDVDGYGENLNSAIHSRSSKLQTIVIQNCNLHHPRSDSNSWNQKRVNGSKHPEGPQGISFVHGKGQYVIRYNKIHSDIDHMYNDGMGELHNFSFGGFPNRDSDIYGNYVSHCWDDGLEIEGANMNVRVWDNYIDMTYGAIGAASPSLGPVYYFRNVYGVSRKHEGMTQNDLRGHYLIKLGNENPIWTAGKMYLFHNTALQPPTFEGDKHYQSSGAQSGIVFTSKRKTASNITSRNNLIHTRHDNNWAIRDTQITPSNDFDYDMYIGKVMAREGAQKNGVRARPLYERASDGRLWLKPGTPGHDAGELLPNFNDDYTGKAPDMGAVETHSVTPKPKLWPAFPEEPKLPQPTIEVPK
tara:strand:+ start:21411 stop:23588 length:2178 start_codon:yes stop_codon:yes gene_type:complete